MVKITKHAAKRAKERASLPKSALESDSERALQYGLGQEDVSGRAQKYMASVFFRHKTSTNTRIYNDLVYCFTSDKTLITLFPLPRNLRALFRKALKEKRERLE
jgi:hypothetical protein